MNCAGLQPMARRQTPFVWRVGRARERSRRGARTRLATGVGPWGRVVAGLGLPALDKGGEKLLGGVQPRRRHRLGVFPQGRLKWQE